MALRCAARPDPGLAVISPIRYFQPRGNAAGAAPASDGGDMIGLLIDLFGLFARRREKLLARSVIRIKHRGFVESLRAHLKQQNPALDDAQLQRTLPLTRPLAGDLVMAYALDDTAQAQYAGESFLAGHGLSLEDVHKAAFANTRAQVARQISQTELQNFIGVESRVAGAASSLVLFPEYWQSWQKKLGAPLLAVVPGRDFVAFRALPAAGPERELALLRAWVMRSAAQSAFEESGSHALSGFAYHVCDGQFDVAGQLGEQDAETCALLQSARGRELLRQGTGAVPEPAG